MATKQQGGQREARRRFASTQKITAGEICTCGHEKKHHQFYGVDLCRKCPCAAFVPVTKRAK